MDNVLMPDEIIVDDGQTILGLGAVTNLDTQAIDAEIEAFHQKKALSIFALAVSGGVLGARLGGAKVGTGSLLLAAVLGGWGYKSLTKKGGA